MNRPSYRAAVAWIANNDSPGDSPGDNDPAEIIAGLVTVCLVADLFGVSNERVAADVIRYREKEHADI